MYKDVTVQPGKSVSVPLELQNIYDFPEDELGSYTFTLDGQSVSFEITANPLAAKPTLAAWVWTTGGGCAVIAALVLLLQKRRMRRAASPGP
jgi:hypothetical protein